MYKKSILVLVIIAILTGPYLFHPVLAQVEEPLTPYDKVANIVPTFGGMFYGENGELYVYLTDLTQNEAVKAAIISVLGSEAIPADGIHVLQAQFSYHQLRGWQDLLTREAPMISGTILGSSDETANRLIIGVETLETQGQVEKNLLSMGIPLEAVTIKLGSNCSSSIDMQNRIPLKAILVNVETAQRIELQIEVQQNTLSLGQYIAQYNVLVPTAAIASNVNEKSKWDNSYSVYGTLRQYWSERFSGADRYVSVSKYEARWTLYDSSVKMSNAKMTAGCYGQFWDGGMCSKWETKSIGIPTSGKWYTQTPSWAGKYVFVNECCFQAGRSEVTLKRGGSTWKLNICVDEGSGC